MLLTAKAILLKTGLIRPKTGLIRPETEDFRRLSHPAGAKAVDYGQVL